MLIVLALFLDLRWARAPAWLAALAVAAAAFGALGVAIGALSREVRAASLLAFMVALPVAALALVPSGAVAAGPYAVVRVVSALFPFKPPSRRWTPRWEEAAAWPSRCSISRRSRWASPRSRAWRCGASGEAPVPASKGRH